MKKRIKFIDISRAFAIIIIVFGHTLVHSEHCHLIFKLIYSFNVPFFFILSGYTFNYNEKFSVFIKKKVKRIIIPYFTWALIFLIPYIVLGSDIAESINVNSTYNIQTQLFNILYGIGRSSALKQNTALWFLPALFTMEIIYYFIMRIVKEDKKKNIIACALILITNFITSNYLKIYFPWGLNTVLNISIFFFYGNCLKKYAHFSEKIFDNKNIPLYLIIGMFACYLNHTISYLDYTYSNFILCLISGISLSNIFIFISQKINSNKTLEYVGVSSMGILIFHKLIILIFQSKLSLISKLLTNSNIFIELFITTIVVIISIVFCLIITKIIKKIFPILIGEK